MYRYQFHVQVKLGEWREFMVLLDRLNEAMGAKDLVPFQLWEAAFGRFDEALLVADDDSLEHYEGEHDALHSDVGCMTTWREMCAHMDGIPWTDLWWRPSRAG